MKITIQKMAKHSLSVLTLILPGGGLKGSFYIFSWKIIPLCGFFIQNMQYNWTPPEKGTLCLKASTIIWLLQKFIKVSKQSYIIDGPVSPSPPPGNIVFLKHAVLIRVTLRRPPPNVYFYASL